MFNTRTRSGADHLDDVPDALVAFYLTRNKGQASSTGAYEISMFEAPNSDGVLVERHGLRVTFDRNASLERPNHLLTFGSDRHRCNVVLKASEASPVHCKFLGDRGHFRHGTVYEDEESSRAQTSKHLIRRRAAANGLHHIKIGDNIFGFHLPSEEREKLQRKRWFDHLDPVLVIEGLLQEQLCGATQEFSQICPIGQGGMAHVFKYMEKTTGLLVAVKEERVTRIGADERIQKEIRYMQNLKHINLVEYVKSEPMVIAGVKTWFTAMPLYQGRLCDLLPLHNSAIEEVMLQLFEGVKYRHLKRVLHKDIKPENILVKGRSRPDIVLADYGICAWLNNPDELVNPLGTRGFAAPEVSRMAVQTTAVDVFALGATLFSISEPGRFQGRSATVASLGNVMQRPPNIYGGLVQSMMSPDAEERPTLETCFHIVKAKHRDWKERNPPL